MSKNRLSVNRRDLFLATASVVATGFLEQSVAGGISNYTESRSDKKAKVVVIGGGYGGITAAKYIKKQNPEVSVILIEKNPFFVSCPMSNHYLGGFYEFSELCFAYNNLTVKYGIEVINDRVQDIDLDKKVVITPNLRVFYDFLILSPGISYDINEEEKAFYKAYPPAFKPGGEHLYLKKLIEEFEGGDIVMTVPAYPYRCPPAPYERAAVILNYLKKRNLKAKLYFIDANERPIINAEGFMNAYYELYKGYAEYITGTYVKSIDHGKKIVKTTNGEFKFSLANVIPPMKASKIVEKIGLLEPGQKWVEVDTFTFETKIKDVYVIGDSARTFLPKSGFGAHMQGKIVANNITEKITGKKSKDELLMVLCYSMVSDEEAIMSETSFRIEKSSGKIIPTHREDNTRRKSTVKRYNEWAKGLWRDLFG
ncbi:MAG: NAD(P)/FAD-dependent oxidoreductase [Hydrogenothermaceae bacterium]|nr:NAD(P)/FAD-dependent oxidoreductase [Hydrogenothermaceae bacterium]